MQDERQRAGVSFPCGARAALGDQSHPVTEHLRAVQPGAMGRT